MAGFNSPTEVTPDDLGRRCPADFAVKPSVTPFDHLENVQLSREERLTRRDDCEFAA